MEKLASAQKALKKLESILQDPVDEKTRDAAIQRFEFTAEICWKALQFTLKEKFSEEIRYPKGCYEAAFRVGLINEELCLALNRTIRDRNLTSHTYHEALAEEIFQRLPTHAASFRALLDVLLKN
jgi:nucleotidyltransferase substrate binding protein (TIGR01987 family)